MDPDTSVVLVLRAWAEQGHVRVRILASGAVRGAWVAASVPDAVSAVQFVLEQLTAGDDGVVTPAETRSETRSETPQ